MLDGTLSLSLQKFLYMYKLQTPGQAEALQSWSRGHFLRAKIRVEAGLLGLSRATSAARVSIINILNIKLKKQHAQQRFCLLRIACSSYSFFGSLGLRERLLERGRCCCNAHGQGLEAHNLFFLLLFLDFRSTLLVILPSGPRALQLLGAVLGQMID